MCITLGIKDYEYYVYYECILFCSCSVRIITSRAFVGPKNFNICVVYEEEWFQHLG